MRTALILILTLTAHAAQAQLGDLLKKVDPNKAKKVLGAAREMTREFSEQEEIDLGRIISARILATYPLAKDEKLQKYVTLVGNTVAAYSARPTLEWHFAVIETPTINAFSAPGGYIFVTTGALEQIKSEAELAALLGHEIAHATQKHILKEVKRSNSITAGLDLAKESGPGRDWLNDDMGERIGNFAYEKLFTTGLSRRDEEEADKIGVQLAAAAGYRAASFLEFLEALKAREKSSEMKVLTSTHPRAEARIAALRPVVKGSEGAVLAERWASWVQP